MEVRLLEFCLMHKTSVYDLLHEKSIEINEQMVFIMALQIARCVGYLHDCDIIHRDLKSLNLLVSKFFEIKICDFGLSRYEITRL